MSNPQIPDLVSTIIPVYNRASLLREAVASVLSQSYRPIEIVIVDDGSTDDTPQSIAAFTSEYECVRSVRIENGGPGVAREAGRQLARGEFIQYLDSDDLLMPTKFDSQVSALRRHPECDVAYGKTGYGYLGEDRAWSPWKRTGERFTTMFPSFLTSRWWGTTTPLYRRRVTDQVGSWLSLRNEEDWEYDSRVALFGGRLVYCDIFVSFERDHAGDRLSRDGAFDRKKLRDRAYAHELILFHAHTAGIDRAAAEMQEFVRELFFLARQCGAAGLSSESKRLLSLAYLAAREGSKDRFEIFAYRTIASIAGWRTIGRLAIISDRLRI